MPLEKVEAGLLAQFLELAEALAKDVVDLAGGLDVEAALADGVLDFVVGLLEDGVGVVAVLLDDGVHLVEGRVDGRAEAGNEARVGFCEVPQRLERVGRGRVGHGLDDLVLGLLRARLHLLCALDHRLQVRKVVRGVAYAMAQQGVCAVNTTTHRL